MSSSQQNPSPAPETAEEPESPSNMKLIECPWCGTLSMRRQERTGLYEELILPLFGLYPWECKFCRGQKYLRYRGRRRKRSS